MYLITLSFDDGFARSCEAIAEIYEARGLRACFNVIARGHEADFDPDDTWLQGARLGDFDLWNRLQERGHEIMPHGLNHANKAMLPHAEAQASIEQCLEYFEAHLQGFVRSEAIFHFPYNMGTPALAAWLDGQVRAYRMWDFERMDGVLPLPHAGTRHLGTAAFGPDPCEEHLSQCIDALFEKPEGWLLYNLHGLDGEGWGPISASFLEGLLDRLAKREDTRIATSREALASA